MVGGNASTATLPCSGCPRCLDNGEAWREAARGTSVVSQLSSRRLVGVSALFLHPCHESLELKVSSVVWAKVAVLEILVKPVAPSVPLFPPHKMILWESCLRSAFYRSLEGRCQLPTSSANESGAALERLVGESGLIHLVLQHCDGKGGVRAWPSS